MTNYTIICMKWGTVYGPEYVNILDAMLKRHLTVPYKFICFTDDRTGVHDHIETREIPDIPLGTAPGFSGWRKLASLSPKLGIEGTVLFLDLDLIIMDNIDSFLTYEPGKFCIIENWTQAGQNIGNSSVYRYEANAHHDIFEDFSKRYDEIYKDKVITNEQHYLTWEVAKTQKVVFWPDSWCRSFKRHSLPSRLFRRFLSPKIPAGCKILVFHGPPKPIDAAYGRWPQKGKFLKPATWILDYWKE
jgi:hypothetical protein